MLDTLSLDRRALALEQAHSYEAHRHQDAATSRAAHGLTVALAREVGTPVSEVGQEVGRRLGWPVYDHELLEAVARDSGVPVTVLEQIDEKPQSWWLECLEGFASTRRLSGSRYLHHLLLVLNALAEHGSCVLIGRGAPQVLPSRSTLRVRLVGSLDSRVTSLGRRLHLGRAEAARRLEELDRERASFLTRLTHKDPTAPENYDLILNTSEWSVAQCAEVILQALQSKAAHAEESVVAAR